jgi:fibronectin type 3 domain-containing protein
VESKVVSLTTLDRIPPRPPSGLRVTVAPAAVQLSWQRNQEPDLAGYRLYRTQLEKDRDLQKSLTESRVELINTKTLPPDTTQYEDTKAEPGKVYSYRISAVDKTGNESPLSPPALASPKSRIPPRPPTSLGGQVQPDGRVLLTWNPSHEAQVSAYHIYRGIGQEGKLVFSAEIPPPPGTDKPCFEDHLNLRSQAVYRYAVSAVDTTDNESPLSDPISISLSDVLPFKPIRRLAPAVPGITALNSGDRFIDVAWSAPTDKDVAGFNVYRSQTSGAPMRLNDKPISAQVFQFRDSGALPGTRYDYSVSAVDKSGNEIARSEPKSSVAFARPENQPPAPSGLRFQTDKSNRYLSWQNSPSATRYIVYFSQDPHGTPRQIAIVSANTFLLPQGAPVGWYAVQAVSGVGSVSARSTPVRLK